MSSVNRHHAENISVTHRPIVGTRPNALVVLVVLSAGLAGPASAQAVNERLEEADRVLPSVVREERVVMPTSEQAAEPVSPGLTGGNPWDDAAAPPARLPEGTFLLERPGRLVPAPADRTVFVPDESARMPGEGPMLILPNAALDRLEISTAGENPPVRVSGEVYVYNGRRYLLISSFEIGAVPAPVEPGDEPAPKSAEEVPDGADDEPTLESLMEQPDVRGLLEELETEAPAPARIDRDAVTPASPESASPGQTVPAPDGTPVFRRRGRLVRAAGGAWLFVFDNDTDDRLAAASLTVLPCRLLERIEHEAETRGDSAEVILSGRVYVHRGQAYLLPTMMTRVDVTDIVPMR